MSNLKTKAPQKLISFSDNKSELERIEKDMKEGWTIISLVQNGNHYIGVMEKIEQRFTESGDEIIYIPPRKKINISY